MPTPYYDNGRGIVLYHGRAEDVLPTLAAGAADLVVTSPPYNLRDRGFFAIARDYAINPRASKGSTHGLAHGYGMHGDALPWEQYRDWQREVLRECWRITAPSGAIFYNHKPRQTDGVARLPLEYNPDLPLRQVVIWDQGQPGINLNPCHFAPRCEWLLLFAHPAFRLAHLRASALGDVWVIQPDREQAHPAPFPIGLPLRAIGATDARTVLDPFAGSGTTLRAAYDLGRGAIGIEIEERYCEIAARRLEQLPLPLEMGA